MEVITYIAPLSSVPQEVTPRQAKLALSRTGHLAAIEAYMDTLPVTNETRINWVEASVFKRFDPLVVAIGANFGLDSAALDDLFIAAADIQ
jgi:hypothetical protein